MDRAGDERTTHYEEDAPQAPPPIYTRRLGTRSAVADSAATEQPPQAGSDLLHDSATNGEAPFVQQSGQTAVASPPNAPELIPWLPTGQVQLSEAGAAEPNTSENTLPQVEPGADLAPVPLSRRWAVLCFVVTLLVYLIFVPRVLDYSSPPTGDQPFYLMMTASLVQDGDLNLYNNHQSHDEDKFYRLAPHGPGFIGIGAPYPLLPQLVVSTVRPPTEWYNSHVPGLSILLVPAWAIGRVFSLWWPATVVFMCIIGALVALNIFMLAYEQAGRLWIAAAVWAVMAFSNPIMTYSYMIFSELTTGLLLIYAFRRLALGWGANRPGRLLLVGICIGYIPWLAWRCLPIAACLLAYAAVQWWRYQRLRRAASGRTNALPPGDSRKRYVLSATLFLAPVVLSAALISWYNIFIYGTAWPQDRVPEAGNSPIFLWPWQGRGELTHFAQAFYGTFFDRIFGLFTYAPVYIMVIVGMIALFRSARPSDRRLFFAIPFVTLPYLGLILTFVFWNGLWCPPARYATTLVPLFAAPLAMSLYACSNRAYRVLFGLLSLYSMAIMALMLNDPRRFWPYNSIYEWLAGGAFLNYSASFPVRIDLWNFLPAVDPLDERSLPNNTGWVTLASLVIVALSYLLMYRERTRSTRHLPYAATMLVWAAALGTTGGAWYFANFDYIQPKTVFTLVQTIGAGRTMGGPHGIEYLDGKVYVANFDGGSVGVFDLAQNSYDQLQVRAGGAAIPVAKPTDIKKGPDNQLYLLNNGPGEDAMYVLKGDGTLVRKIALNSASAVASGLQFGPDGSLYVADVGNGAILKYSVNGGEPLGRYSGESSGFNNVQGVAVTADGKIYAAESSNGRIQEIDNGGNYIRSFTLGCTPNYIAATGDWLDVSCPGKGIASVNPKNGNFQYSKFDPDDSANLKWPTGVAYGSDGRFYAIDGDILRVYTVKH